MPSAHEAVMSEEAVKKSTAAVVAELESEYSPSRIQLGPEKVAKVKLSNGATLLVREDSSVPLVSIRAVSKGGLLAETAANNGVSAVIDAEGRVLARLALNARGVIDSPLPRARPATLYARYGDGPFALMLLVAAVVAWRMGRGRTAASDTSG